jgi:hypothetical protein
MSKKSKHAKPLIVFFLFSQVTRVSVLIDTFFSIVAYQSISQNGASYQRGRRVTKY